MTVSLRYTAPCPDHGQGLLLSMGPKDMGTPSILERIIAAKHEALAEAQRRQPRAVLEEKLLQGTAPAVRSFWQALDAKPTVQIIAELKRASPSAGMLSAGVNLVELARCYETFGAACISVLTDEPFFHGCLDDLRMVRSAVSLPLLRKDFIIDPYQILEARLAGADAVLLIAEILTDEQLLNLRLEIERWGMTALVECHEAAALDRVLQSGARLIGVNNRNLHTFATRLEQTVELAQRIPGDRLLVSESGFKTRADVETVARAGAEAILVGETLMRSGELKRVLQALLGVPVQPRPA